MADVNKENCAMHIGELPKTKRIGASADKGYLTQLIKKGFNNSWAHSYEIIEGGPCSMRIFFAHHRPDGVSLPGAMHPRALAQELTRFSSEARYPERSSTKNKEKGWELRTAAIENKPALIAIAAWV